MKQRVLLTIILLMVFCSYSFALIGGAGTKYDPNHIDGTYAHIDGGSSKPGYLSPKVYDVWVAGKQVNIINMSDVLGDGGSVKSSRKGADLHTKRAENQILIQPCPLPGTHP